MKNTEKGMRNKSDQKRSKNARRGMTKLRKRMRELVPA
jgi:hypothetical protein